ncbi:MAG: hypothetical protein CBB97_09490 [Candidatus Endolissoclinum sp. TMED37]|nr:MAG: hypothetical protein CBB97_09490 [Candidatus Endolissoclinum sp. TMED37]
MIEIFSIIIQFFIFTIFCYTPNNIYFFIKKDSNPKIFERLEVGIILNLFILLILSFILRSGSNLIYYLLIIIFLLNFIFFIKDSLIKYKSKKLKFNPIFLIFTLLFFIFSIDLANNLKIGWDAQNYWLAKKLIFSNGGDFFDLKNTPRDDYPYLGSFIWHIYSKFSLSGFEYFGRLFYIYLFLLSIFIITSVSKFKNLERIILIFILVFSIYKVELFNGYQEILNFSLLIFLTKIFYDMLQKKTQINKIDNSLLYLFILISSIIWIKSESSVLIMLFLIPIFLLKNFDFKTKIIFVSIFILLLTKKYYVFSLIGLSHEIQKGNYEYFQIINFFEFINFSRATIVLKYIFFYFLNNVVYILFCISFLIFFKLEKRNNYITYIFSMFLLSLVFFMAAFLLSSFPLEWVLWTALNRVMFETSGLFIILIPLTYELLKKKKFFKINF